MTSDEAFDWLTAALDYGEDDANRAIANLPGPEHGNTTRFDITSLPV